jgi:hypothetical protein
MEPGLPRCYYGTTVGVGNVGDGGIGVAVGGGPALITGRSSPWSRPAMNIPRAKMTNATMIAALIRAVVEKPSTLSVFVQAPMRAME